MTDTTVPLMPRARNYGMLAVFALVAVAILFLLALRLVYAQGDTEHFRYLAYAFIHGSFAVDNLPQVYQDKVLWNGHIYIPLGPLPGLVLMPMAALFGLNFDEYWVSLALTVLNIWLLNRILLRLGIADKIKRRWLLVLFFCGTIYFTALLRGNAWFLSHILTTTCLFLAIDEGLGKQRAFLVGFWMGAVFLGRVTAAFGIVFFLLLWWRSGQLSLRKILWLGLGLVPAFLFFIGYNYARFGSPFETGYGHAFLVNPILAQALSYGLFSPVHIPKNLYMLLLAMPQPVPGWDAPVLQFPYILPSAWGMGILVTTPLFVYALRAPRSDTRVAAAWLAVLAISIPLLMYYGIGWSQFGYRYALDFYPFLFIPTALALYAAWNRWVPALIILCIAINLWGAFLSLAQKYAA